MVIGTAPHEWLDDREAWRAALGMEGVRLEPGDLRAWEGGPIGWLSDRPRFVFPDDSVVLTRLTAVMRQEQGSWRLDQVHFSVGVPDEKVAEVLQLTSPAEHGLLLCRRPCVLALEVADDPSSCTGGAHPITAEDAGPVHRARQQLVSMPGSASSELEIVR